MNKYDYIIIGAGMGGLSTANFLAKYGKSVLVLEKHDKVGGFCTSFQRKGTSFDCGIESLHELEPKEAIPQFFAFWGGNIKSEKHVENICCFIDDDIYKFRNGYVKENFLSQFPNDKDNIEKLFSINDGIIKQMCSDNHAPVPPYEMNIFELIKFGIHNMQKKPLLMKYGIKNFDVTLSRIVRNKQIATIVFSKAMSNMVYLGYAYRWWVSDKSYYPQGGMQAIPDSAVQTLEQYGGTVLLNMEVSEIVLKNGQVKGVKTSDGNEYFTDNVISNVSPAFTYSLLPSYCAAKTQMLMKIQKKKIFQSGCLLFMVMDDISVLTNNNFIYIANSNSCTVCTETFTPENCPIVLQVLDKKPTDKYYAVTAMAPIPYEYMNDWNTNGTKIRGKNYYELKEKAKQTLLDRIYEKLGDTFKSNVIYTELGTPLTLERYTNSANGSFMGWAIDKPNYGKFLRQRTLVPNLSIVGQWTFPGFGIAGVMAGGYYLANDLLKSSNIDLKKDFELFFSTYTK